MRTITRWLLAVSLAIVALMAQAAHASVASASTAPPAVDAASVQYNLTGACSVSDGCAYNAFNVTGYYHYGSRGMFVIWPDGHGEVFVVGLDSHAWHIVNGWSSWRPMGGTMFDMRSAYFNYRNNPAISVYTATTTGIWCSEWTGSAWQWYNC